MPAPVLVGSGSGNAAALTATATITAGTGNIVFVSVGFTNFFSTTGTLSISGGGVSWSQIGAQITGSSSYNATAALFYAILTAPLSGATITATSTRGTDPGLAIAWAAYSATTFYLDPTALPAPTANSGSNGNISTTINTSGSTEFVISAYCNSNGSLPTAQVPVGSTILQSPNTLGLLGPGYLILTISPYYTSPQTSLSIGVTASATSSALIAAAFVGAAPPSPGPNPEIPPQLTILRAQAADEDTIAGIRPLALRNRTIPLGSSALVLADRVMETTNTTGTGTVICTGPVAQYQPFTAIGAGNTTWYAIISGDGVNWETGVGTITQLNPSGIARTTVLSSSNGGALISLSGISTIFCDLPAKKVLTGTPATLGTNTFTGEQITAASTAANAGLNVPPGTAPTAPVNGDVWTTALGLYARINGVTVGPYIAGGGGYWPGYNLSVGVPALSAFTWVNQGTMTVVDKSPYGLQFNIPNSTSQLGGMIITPPAAPYRVAIALSMVAPMNLYESFYAWFYDGTKFHVLGIGANTNVPSTAQVQRWSSATAYSSSDYSGQISVNMNLAFLGLRDDGTNVYFEISPDGVAWTTLYSVAKASGYLSSYTFKIGFGFQPDNNATVANVAAVLKLWDVNGLTRTYP